MSNITMEKNIAIDLLNTKLRSLKDKIEEILEKWNQTSSSKFIEKTRKGDIPEAEMDTI